MSVTLYQSGPMNLETCLHRECWCALVCTHRPTGLLLASFLWGNLRFDHSLFLCVVVSRNRSFSAGFFFKCFVFSRIWLIFLPTHSFCVCAVVPLSACVWVVGRWLWVGLCHVARIFYAVCCLLLLTLDIRYHMWNTQTCTDQRGQRLLWSLFALSPI